MIGCSVSRQPAQRAFRSRSQYALPCALWTAAIACASCSWLFIHPLSSTAAGTESVSFPKPVRFALCSVDRGHRLCKLLLAIHPPAQFVSSVLVNNSDLIFTTVFVRHMLSP